MKISDIAAVCHEANRRLCLNQGDTSQRQWEAAPQWQKDSAINGVTFHMQNPDATPEASHESWLAEKVAAGWIYGETKDEEAKTHPCMRPYDELPQEQQAKDHLFRAIAHSLIPFLEDLASEAVA